MSWWSHLLALSAGMYLSYTYVQPNLNENKPVAAQQMQYLPQGSYVCQGPDSKKLREDFNHARKKSMQLVHNVEELVAGLFDSDNSTRRK